MVGLALSLLLLAQPPASACPVSDEPEFATTREHAVQVGGGAMYVAARERRYLDALRGPSGEPVQYKRTGSLPLEGDGRTILDRYELTYVGLDKPIVLFLDAYHYDDALRAPKGLTCAVPIALGPPPPDLFLADESLVQLAIEQSGKDLAPVPLDADGGGAHGVLFDRFRRTVRAARVAAAGGTPLDPKHPPREILRLGSMVVAYPLRCADRMPVPAAAIEILPAQGPPPARQGELATGDALAAQLPNVELPPGAAGTAFALDRPRPADRIRIAYPDGTCGPSTEVLLPMTYANAKPIATPMPALPAGQPATDRPVILQALIDTDGAARRVVYIGGPAALASAAIEAVQRWTAEPARLNGAPVVTAVMLQVRFGSR